MKFVILIVINLSQGICVNQWDKIEDKFLFSKFEVLENVNLADVPFNIHFFFDIST